MFPKGFPGFRGCHNGSSKASAAVAGAALAVLGLAAGPASASTLVSVVLGWATSEHIVIPAAGTVAAAPSVGDNIWNGFGNVNDGAPPYDASFSPIDSNGNATNITGTFTETNPTYQSPYYANSSSTLPPFVNYPAATNNGSYGQNVATPTNPYGPDTLTLNGLNPAGSYDVFVYSAFNQGDSSAGADTPTVSLDLTTGSAATTSYTYTYDMGAPNSLDSYQLGTNYEEFQNVTPDSAGTIAISGTGVNTSLFNAFQIYSASPVPEPASLGLMAIGGLGLLMVSRRRTTRQST